MRYAIFSDVHANLEALEAVLADMRSRGIDRTLCLGDLVGYNADPGECLDRIRALECPVVRGNHDQEAVGGHPTNHFNALAAAGVAHSRSQLAISQKFFLVELPLQQEVDGFTLVHAGLLYPERWGYIRSVEEAGGSFSAQKTALCFFGHTHVPHLFAQTPDGKVTEHIYHTAHLDPAKRYLINVGSVGQPRDGDWRAAYAIYDSVHKTIELRRVPYDIEKAQRKILAAGLPGELAVRLRFAR